jgi:hypothetical protein
VVGGVDHEDGTVYIADGETIALQPANAAGAVTVLETAKVENIQGEMTHRGRYAIARAGVDIEMDILHSDRRGVNMEEALVGSGLRMQCSSVVLPALSRLTMSSLSLFRFVPAIAPITVSLSVSRACVVPVQSEAITQKKEGKKEQIEMAIARQKEDKESRKEWGMLWEEICDFAFS